ncbi:hypothetical protein FB379_14115 [Aeribacillus composti]|uniref:hypothetical protein n=1 Tax=Aeribacillus composti TaxID=1868734 RepID=UPI0011997CD2|nr:hypothetical protein [Aeribacillus composti]TVZ76107.1 hypothetical protein FB379_14115 [Aeribacillus composti]
MDQNRSRLERAEGYLSDYEKQQAIVEKYEHNPFLKGKMLFSKSIKQEYEDAVAARDRYKFYMENEGVSGRTDFEKQVDQLGKMEARVPEFKGQFESFEKWVDPINLQVNKVETEMAFNYNGSSVTSCTARDRREWLTETGWSESSHNLSHAFVGGRNAQAKTKSTMRNSAFCVGQPATYVYYNTNNITVYYNGSASGNVSTYASGGCSSWLSYSTALI